MVNRTSVSKLSWAEPLVIKVMRQAQQPLTMTEICKIDPILARESARHVAGLLAGMATRGILRSHPPEPGKRLQRYELPPPPSKAAPKAADWKRPEYKHDRAMQAAIERCRGTRFISMNVKAGSTGKGGV